MKTGFSIVQTFATGTNQGGMNEKLKQIRKGGKMRHQATAWEVYRNGKALGIVESHYQYAVKYWQHREQVTGNRFTLKPVFFN